MSERADLRSGDDAPVSELHVPGRFAFLREGRWLGLIASMLVVSVVCTILGFWQWNRHQDRSYFAQRIETSFDAPVETLPAVLGEPPAAVDVQSEWRRVALTGTYQAEDQVILRARPVDGEVAVRILTPFLATASGGQPLAPVLVIVDRGWIPGELGDQMARGEVPLPRPPAGEVTIEGRLRVAEQADSRVPSPGITLRVEPGQVLQAAELPAGSAAAQAPVLQGYLQAAGDAGTTADTADPTHEPRGYSRPSTTLGNNLSYAFQWWFFAVGAQVAWLILARREADEREEELLFGMLPGRGGTGHGPGGAGAGPDLSTLPAGESLSAVRRKPRSRTEDDDVEDALVDDWLR